MKILVEGIGITKFGELWDKNLLDLAYEAGNQAILDAQISSSNIEAVFIGNMLSGILDNQLHLGAAIAQILNLGNIPSFRVEAACASGGSAVHQAINALLAKQYSRVLVIGVEKMTDTPTNLISSALMSAASEDERLAGFTFPALYALLTTSHMKKYSTTREQLAKISVKNHQHATFNPNAHFTKKIIIDQVLNSSTVASPLTLLDSSPISDGAAALVLSLDHENKISKSSKNVYITASTVASDSLDLSKRQSLTELIATKRAAANAYKQSGITPKDIDVAEVHDCFTIGEILATEDLGFCKKGEGGQLIDNGDTSLGGKLPVNTSGGLKAAGHPVGATGVKQIIEITQQLRGVAGSRQVQNAKCGLTQNVGGTGATVVVHVLQI